MSEGDDEFPNPPTAAEFARRQTLSKSIPSSRVATALLWTSVGTLILTFLWIIIGMLLPVGGTGGMRGVAHFGVVRAIAGIGVSVSAILGLIASFYRAEAIAIFVFELFLLGLCLYW